MFDLKIPRLPYREDTLFSLLGFTIFVVPLAFNFTYESYETIKFALLLILTGACLLVFIGRQRSGKLAIKYNRLFFGALAGWLLLALLSTAGSMDRLYSMFGFYYRFTSGLLFYCVFAMFTFLLFQVMDEGRFMVLLKTLTFGSLTISVISFLQSIGIGYYAGLDAGGFVRPPGPLGNPDFTGMFLAVAMPFVLFLLIKSKSFYGRIYYVLCLFCMVLANMVLASRGALLALAVGFVFVLGMLLVYRADKKLLVGLMVFCLAGAVLAGLFLNASRPQAVSSLFSDNDSNVALRLYDWEVSSRILSGHPWLGTGPGTFALAFERNRPANLAGDEGIFDDAHNLFLQMAVTTGLPFALIFFGIIAGAGYYGLKQFHKSKDLQVLCCLAGLVIWTAAVSFNPVAIPMFLFLGLILSGLLLPLNRVYETNARFWQKTSIIISGVILALFGASLITAEYLYAFARSDYDNQSYHQAYVLSDLALKINPTNQLYYNLAAGSEIFFQRNPASVIKDIEKVKSLHPLQANSYVEVSNLYNLYFQNSGKKQYLQAAVANMATALTIDPYYAGRYSQLALYEYELGNLVLSRQELVYSLDLSDQDFSQWMLLAKIYQLQNNRAAFMYALNQAFKINPDSYELRYVLTLAKTTGDIKDLPLNIVLPNQEIN